MLQGPNGDLWCLVLRSVGMSWIRAHTNETVAVSLGFAALDRAGNAAADHAALAQARLLRPPLNHRLARGRLRKAIRLSQVMIAEVQIAAIAANRVRLPKIKYKRRIKRRFCMRRPRKGPRPRPTSLAAHLGEGPPDALHMLSVAYGPPPESIATSRRLVFPWALHCSRCVRIISGTGRWSAFGRTLCTASPAYLAHSWSEGPHVLARVAGGWACVKCGLAATPARRAAAARALCPVPDLLGPDGRPVVAARPWVAQYVRLAVSWRTSLRAPPPPPVPLVDPAVLPVLRLQWSNHWVLSGVAGSSCLRCGLSARRRDPRRLQGTPCPGVVLAAAALVGPLLAGRFDVALAAALPAWVLKARELGWVPVPSQARLHDPG